jgi:hypothetical protein
MNLQGSAALLLLISMSGAAAITCVAVLDRGKITYLVVSWSLSVLWLMWGLAISTELRRIRRGH